MVRIAAHTCSVGRRNVRRSPDVDYLRDGHSARLGRDKLFLRLRLFAGFVLGLLDWRVGRND